METLFKDLRYGLRGLLKRKGFCGDRSAHACAWHWREHGDLYARQCSDAEVASG